MVAVGHWCIHFAKSSCQFLLFLDLYAECQTQLASCIETSLSVHSCWQAPHHQSYHSVMALTNARLKKKKNQKGSCWSALTWLSACNKIYGLRGFPLTTTPGDIWGLFPLAGKTLDSYPLPFKKEIISNYLLKWSCYTILTIFISFSNFSHTFNSLQENYSFFKFFLCSLFLLSHSELSPCMFRPQTWKRIWGDLRKCRKCQCALIFLSFCLGCSDRKPVVPVGGCDNVLKSLNPAAHTHWQGTPVTRRRPNTEGNPLACAFRRYPHAGLPALSTASASFTRSHFVVQAAAIERRRLAVAPSPCPLTLRLLSFWHCVPGL